MPLVPHNIKTLVPYKAGRRIEDVAREYGLSRIVKLASNENPFGPSPLAIKAATETLSQVHRYPDPASFDLRTALAKRFNVKVENVITGAGSEGIMSAIMRTFLLPSDEIVSSAGSFIGFQVLARASGRTVHWIPMRSYRYDLETMARAVNEYTKIVYVANPDNPTGSYITVDEFDRFMARIPPRVLVILDEAYFEFASRRSDYPDSMHYRYDNVITLRTFSKAHGLAGLRVGYGFGHGEVIENLLKVKLPFEPALPAQAAALAALEDEEHLSKTIENNRQGLEYLRQSIESLGLPALPSAANFVTMVLSSAEQAQRITAELLRRGVIVRPLEGFGWPALIRVSIGLPEENEAFVAALGEVLRGP